MENKLISITKLISTTDFVIRAMQSPDYVDENGERPYKESAIIKNGVSLSDCFRITYNYANFLKQPLKLGMFVPCDENDVPLDEPKNYDLWCKYGDFTQYGKSLTDICKPYKEAQDRVLFDGFEVIGQSEGFCEIELKNGDFWMTFVGGEIKVTNQFNQEYSVHIIEDLIQENLTLTASAIKQFEL
jgi:hypothetical protein